MDRKPKTYTNEFKLEAVRIAVYANICKSDLAYNIGIQPGTLQQWIYQFGAEVKANIGNETVTVNFETIQKLKKDIQKLQVERDLLLQAAAIFLNSLK